MTKLSGEKKIVSRLEAIAAWTKRGRGRGFFCISRNFLDDALVAITDIQPERVAEMAGEGFHLCWESVGNGGERMYSLVFNENGVKTRIVLLRITYEWPKP